MAGAIPFSNPAGNNQTNPITSMLPKGSATPGGGASTTNPFQALIPQSPHTPVAGGNVPGSGTGGGGIPNKPGVMSTGASDGFITDKSSYSSGQNDLSKQFEDIYGKGVGGSLFQLLNSMSGTNSDILQKYIASLQPQMAKAGTNLQAGLGASGVSANSSVNAIAQSDLAAQEQAAIAGESANLTKSQEELTAQILSGTAGTAQKQVATSGWSVFGDVLSEVGKDAAAVAPMFL